MILEWKLLRGFSLLLLSAILLGCDGSTGKKGAKEPSVQVIKVPLGDKAEKELQRALIQIKPGGRIELEEGVYHCTRRLSLDVENVHIKGQGKKKTILSFKGQKSGAEGLLVTKGGFTIEDLAIEDSRGDALKIKKARRVIIRRVRTEWTNGPDEKNGAYGIYPVECEDLLIEHCIAIGASDAGIYVGQSKNIIVRRNIARLNVAGIEIENSKHADVYENKATGNTGGILVFDLPNLPVMGGEVVRVFNNEIADNNHKNFAPKGNIVASVPAGTGIMIMANDQIEIFKNTIRNHGNTNLCVVSYFAVGKKFKDAKYDPYPEGIYIHDNVFEGGGDKPDGPIGQALSQVFKKLPDAIWDGVINPATINAGKRPKGLGVYFKNNGNATFANINLIQLQQGKPNIDTDLNNYAGEIKALPAVTIEGVK
jgi:parallel beta-helix repeat protein